MTDSQVLLNSTMYSCDEVPLRLFGAPAWNLEWGPISNKEEGGNIFILGFGAPGFSPVSPTLNPPLGPI